MRLYLLRHPKTMANRDGLVVGGGDSLPTPEGLLVFRRVMELLRPEPVVGLLSSPLPRALAGARIAAVLFRLRIEIEPGLAELSCGQWEGRPRAELGLAGRPIRRRWDDRPPGGESCRDAEARLAPLIGRLQAENRPGSVLIVGHAVVNRVFLKLWLDLDHKTALAMEQGFHEVFVLTAGGRLETLAATGKD
ncbi:MAG: histidine phosphatase family protein [Pseudomonadota bacterium]